MSADKTPDTYADVGTLNVFRTRHAMAVKQLETLGNTGMLRAFALCDVPILLEVAERGVQARIVLDPIAGLSIRAATLRALHCAEDLGGGLIVCAHCSYGIRLVPWPCPTTQVLDGIDAP